MAGRPESGEWWEMRGPLRRLWEVGLGSTCLQPEVSFLPLGSSEELELGG